MQPMSKDISVNYSNLAQQDQIATFLNIRTSLKDRKVSELKQMSIEDRLPFAFASLSVTGDLNVGAMLRTAYSLGASEGYVIGRRKLDNRSLVGVQNYFNIKKIESLKENQTEVDPEQAYSVFIENNLCPILLEDGGENLPKVNWVSSINKIKESGKTPCISVGNEGRGISDEVLFKLKTIPNSMHISIPMLGVMRSFNVGHALSICMWDMVSKMGWVS